MTENKQLATQEFTRDQVDLIKATVAKGATDNELKLFMHNCKRLGLDPFAKQVHFIKYGTSPGTIIVGIDGFRLVASRTGQHSGTKRGVLRNDKGDILGAWCEIYRKDWTHPAREEVPFNEYYNDRNPSWKKMPETMIKKVAECAALRMAFPAELSGVYGHEEMDQAVAETKEALQPKSVSAAVDVKPEILATQPTQVITPKVKVEKQVENKTAIEGQIDAMSYQDLLNYKFKSGVFAGKTIGSCEATGLMELSLRLKSKDKGSLVAQVIDKYLDFSNTNFRDEDGSDQQGLGFE